MKPKIATYLPKDNSAVKQIYCEILQKEWCVPSDSKQLEADLDESFADEVVLLAFHNDKVIGFISWYEPDAFIHHLYISAPFRGFGVGKELINSALERLRYPVRLKCLKSNKSGLEFYFYLGWYLAGEGTSDEGDFFVMEYSKIENKKEGMENFKIHDRLQNDCYLLGKLPLCHLLLMKNAEVPWFILVPETPKLEIHELDSETQKKLFQEALELSAMLKNILKVDKINLGAIGNVVSQLHFHVVGRRVNDYAWPKVVWGAEGFRAYQTEELQNLVGIVRSSFGSRLIT